MIAPTADKRGALVRAQQAAAAAEAAAEAAKAKARAKPEYVAPPAQRLGGDERADADVRRQRVRRVLAEQAQRARARDAGLEQQRADGRAADARKLERAREHAIANEAKAAARAAHESATARDARAAFFDGDSEVTDASGPDEETLAALAQLGFDRERACDALVRAAGDVERAASLLLDGDATEAPRDGTVAAARGGGLPAIRSARAAAAATAAPAAADTRAALRREQDAAFETSLAADRTRETDARPRETKPKKSQPAAETAEERRRKLAAAFDRKTTS